MKKTLAILAFGLVAGCAGAPSTVAVENQAIDLGELPDLPGCLALRPTGTLTARAVKDADDLYVLFEDGEARCIDSTEGFMLLHLGLTTTTASSNPMPGQPPSSNASSNPMPGTPGDPAASNPMPGTDTGGSNPMPGHPSYEQQGYTQTR